MNRIIKLLPLIFVVAGAGACAAPTSASPSNDATSQVQAGTGQATNSNCPSGQVTLPGGACAAAPESCNGYGGPCNMGLTGHDLTGCFAANYKTPVQIGDGATYRLAVDTGSSNMAVAASGCQSCAVSPEYTPGTGAVNQNATITSSYADGSGWSGTTYVDTVKADDTIGDVSMAFTAIGAQVQQSNTSNLFFAASQCNGSDDPNTKQGILGMGGSALATSPDQAFVDMMQQSGNVAGAFAVQFCDMGGRMWFGGYDPNYMTQPPTFVPMDTSSGFYRVTIDDVEVNGASIGAAQSSYGPSIADTGTGAILLPDAAFQPLIATIGGDANFAALFPASMLASPGQCVSANGNVSRADIDAMLPTLSFVLSGSGSAEVTIELPATSSYILPLQQVDGNILYCSTLGSSESLANQSAPLLGNPFMHSQIVIFDRDNAQMGFAPQRYCQDSQ